MKTNPQNVVVVFGIVAVVAIVACLLSQPKPIENQEK